MLLCMVENLSRIHPSYLYQVKATGQPLAQVIFSGHLIRYLIIWVSPLQQCVNFGTLFRRSWQYTIFLLKNLSQKGYPCLSRSKSIRSYFHGQTHSLTSWLVIVTAFCTCIYFSEYFPSFLFFVAFESSANICAVPCITSRF